MSVARFAGGRATPTTLLEGIMAGTSRSPSGTASRSWVPGSSRCGSSEPTSARTMSACRRSPWPRPGPGAWRMASWWTDRPRRGTARRVARATRISGVHGVDRCCARKSAWFYTWDHRGGDPGRRSQAAQPGCMTYTVSRKVQLVQKR